MKKEYEELDIEITIFPTDDVVTVSVVEDIPRDSNSDMGEWQGG